MEVLVVTVLTYCRQLKNRRRNGFTGLEVLFVVAILAILACVASVFMFGDDGPSKQDKAERQAKAIATAAKSYYEKHKKSPPNTKALIDTRNAEKPFLEGGDDSIVTPWGGQFTLSEDRRGQPPEKVILVYWVDGDGKKHNQFEKRVQ
jgi:prepilin-type N-terminal cleavage/methylation domain-containing protein